MRVDHRFPVAPRAAADSCCRVASQGCLDLEGYLGIGGKRAANFSPEMRRKDVWPIFCKYQRVKAQERR